MTKQQNFVLTCAVARFSLHVPLLVRLVFGQGSSPLTEAFFHVVQQSYYSLVTIPHIPIPVLRELQRLTNNVDLEIQGFTKVKDFIDFKNFIDQRLKYEVVGG